jgi:preprotein translocase subunit YajC
VNPAIGLVWLVILAGAFWMLVVKPQRRQMMAMRTLQSALEVGDEVVTTSGIYGVVIELRDTNLDLEIAPNTVIRIARGAISGRSTDRDAAAGPNDDPGDDPGQPT